MYTVENPGEVVAWIFAKSLGGQCILGTVTRPGPLFWFLLQFYQQVF
jgi:hypothetical protein